MEKIIIIAGYGGQGVLFFGTTLAVEYIMRGVENSLRLSGQIYHPEIAKKYSSVKENILDTKQRLLDDSN